MAKNSESCKHEGIDVCGHGMGIAECPGCGGHVDLMDLGRGNIELDEGGAWVTVSRSPSMPLDEPKCSMMRAVVPASG